MRPLIEGTLRILLPHRGLALFNDPWSWRLAHAGLETPSVDPEVPGPGAAPSWNVPIGVIGRDVRFPPDIVSEEAHNEAMTTTASIARRCLMSPSDGDGRRSVALLTASGASPLRATR